jgi:hypothetical protein
MVGIAELIRESGGFGLVLMFGLLAGPLWAVVCAGLLAAKWRVPPVVSTVPLVLTPLLAAMGGVVAQMQIDEALVHVDASQKATLLAVGIAETLSLGMLGTTVLPSAILLGMGGLVAGIRAPRAWGIPAITFLFAGLVALFPAVGLVWHADAIGVIGRVFVYGLAVLPLMLATASGHPGKNAPEGGVTAAAAFFATVASLELAQLSQAWRLVFQALAHVSPESKRELLAVGIAETDPLGTLAWVTVLLAAVPLLVTAFRPSPTLTEEEIMAGLAGESPWRGVGRVLALGVPAAWLIAMFSLDPVDVLQRIAALF